MAHKHTFRARIEEGRGGGAFVTVPFDVEETFGKKRVPVTVTIDGEPYRGSLVRMGSPSHMLGILKGIRDKIGKQVGDEVEITLQEDSTPREVKIPADLKTALGKAPSARAFFDGLSYTHQKEYVRWIEEAKRQETRKDRVARTLEMLGRGTKGR